MKVLVIGSGGREHAMCWKISQSPKLTKLFAAPGNAGMAEFATLVDIPAKDQEGLLKFCKHEGINFVIVGPEAPLTEGIVDRFRAGGHRAGRDASDVGVMSPGTHIKKNFFPWVRLEVISFVKRTPIAPST